MTPTFALCNSLLFRWCFILACVFGGWQTAFAEPPKVVNVLADQNKAIDLSKTWDRQSHQTALQLFQKASQDWIKLSKYPEAVFCLHESAKLFHINADYRSAFAALEKSILITEQHNLAEQKALSFGLLVLSAVEKGDQKSAEAFSFKARSMAKNSNFPPETLALIFYSSGMYEYFYGKMKSAITFFEQAESNVSKTDNSFLTVQILHFAGYSYLRDGQIAKASEKLRTAQKLSEESGNTKGIALSFSGLGFLSYFLNEKQKALDYFKKSETLFPDDFEWLERARVVNAIGSLHSDFGEFDLAETYFQKAVDYYEKGNYLPGKTTTLTHLADVFAARNDIDKARQTYQSAILLNDQIGDPFSLATIKVGLGHIELKSANFELALKIYLQARQIFIKIGVRLPELDNLIGQTYEKKNDLISARNYFQKALAVNEQRNDHFPLAETLFLLAKLEYREDNLKAAIDLTARSIELSEKFYSDVAGSKLKQSFLSNFFPRYEFYISLLMEKHKLNPEQGFHLQALQIAEKVRSRGMLENLKLSEADFNKGVAQQTIEREKQLRNLMTITSDKITDLLVENIESDEIGRLKNELNELNIELEQINAEIKQKSPLYSAINSPAVFDLTNFQSTVLDENSIFCEFFLGERESYLWLIGKNDFEVFILPGREEIEGEIQILRDLISAVVPAQNENIEAFQERVQTAEIEFWAKAQTLSDKLLGPIAHKIIDKRLIIAPSGNLHLLPLSALPKPFSNERKPLLLSNEIIYEPSAEILSVLINSDAGVDQIRKSVLVLADPVFTAEDLRVNGQNPSETIENNQNTVRTRFAESLFNLPRLPASKKEGEAIRDIFGDGSGDYYFGFEANREKAVASSVSKYRIIHFAAHGLVFEDRPELSGIVLSGLNSDGNKIDQVVRLHDILGLDLNADLVVLSACSTGIGKEIKGEGVQSLNNAFLSVGAKTVVSSLWKVEDSATLELMSSFYQSLSKQPRTASQSLREAQIKLWGNPRFRSPFYWAGFTAQGDFRRLPQLPSSNFYRNLILLMGFLTICLTAILLLQKKVSKHRRRTAS